MNAARTLALVGMVLLSCACVKRSEYESKVAEATTCASHLSQTNQNLVQSQALAQSNAAQAAELKTELDARTNRANKELADIQRQLDEATALHSSLRAELQRMGADVDKLLREKGLLATSLEQAKTRLEELRRAQASAVQRAEAYRNLLSRFKQLADAGQLKIRMSKGRMVLDLPNDVLFDPASTEIKAAGQTTLKEVATILASLQNRQFQVLSHTDDQPIQSTRFPSNWSLSAARAVRVVEFLIKSGMAPTSISAAGFAEFSPVAPNDSPENKTKNRRIEIVLEPNLDELLTAP